jgi:hypothetical protein
VALGIGSSSFSKDFHFGIRAKLILAVYPACHEDEHEAYAAEIVGG